MRKKGRIKSRIPGIPISDPSGPAALGFKIGFISVFMSYSHKCKIGKKKDN